MNPLKELSGKLTREDLDQGRLIDKTALDAEHKAVKSHAEADLREAIRLWRIAKRDDRADALEATLKHP
jgi:hypothetical protein